MKIKWNKVIYADCMNEENGLPTLPDKSIDLCITDPPFNVHLGLPDEKSRKSRNIRSSAKYYIDNRKDYPEWCLSWFNELKRICKGILVYCGSKNLSMWSSIESPRQIIYRYSKNSPSPGSMTFFTTIYPILCYGKFKNRLKHDIFKYPSKSGWNSSGHFLHPCPLNENLWIDIISQLKPESVIDPFLGSGTTAEVCTKLGIPWIGYEIMKEYSVDINKRLKNCKKEPQQVSLEEFK